MTNTFKPKAIPVHVPWNVVLAVPVLSIQVIEQNSVKVSFEADFGPLDPYTGKRSKEARIEYPEDRPPIIHNPDRNKFVEITFPFTTDVRINPALMEGRVIDHDAFDWSELKMRWDEQEDIYINLRDHIQLWYELEASPLPGMYSIEPSVWLQSKRKRDRKHYMILGEDMWIEVLAEEWSWKLVDER